MPKEILSYPWAKEEIQIIKAAWATEPGRLALELIVDRLSILHGQALDPDPHLTSFNEGRRFVGRSLKDAINLPLNKLVKEAPNDTRKQRVPTTTERALQHVAGHLAADRAIRNTRR